MSARAVTGRLLERARELELLAAAREEAERTGRGRVVLVGGEAGVGKTTLVRAFVDVDGAGVLRGACDPLFTPQPLGPLLAVAEEAGGELHDVVGGDGKPHEVAAALVRTLAALAPSVFVLEDAHWADEATLDVLRLLTRRVESIPALVVVTYRDDLERDHPWRLVLGELGTGHAVRRLKLAPLSRDAVGELAGPYGVDAGDLYRKTRGNPFFVVEALAAGAAEIPDTIRDAVLARAAPLGAAARTVLDATALVPPRAELWLLEALTGAAFEGIDECLAAGMLDTDGVHVSFRHELARLAVEDAVAPRRRLELHRAALAALADPPDGAPDTARLTHHADAAGDVEGVLRYAPLAAARAAALGAHREAAAHYARALRFRDRLPVAERAALSASRSVACYLTDQSDDAIAAVEEALACRRELGQTLEEGDSLRWLSQILWCPGRTAEAAQTGREAVELLERLPPGRELAMALANLAAVNGAASRFDDAVEVGRRALELAERVGDEATAVNALATIGLNEPEADGRPKLEHALVRALQAGLDEQAGRIYVLRAVSLVGRRRHADANIQVPAGIEFCSEHGLELFRAYLLAFRARSLLDQGRWDEAAESASATLAAQRTSVTPGIVALVVLGLVRARRGDPEPGPPLERAWALAEPSRELQRLGPVAAARAEVAWLARDPDGVAAATEPALPLARALPADPTLAQLALWRRRADLHWEPPPMPHEPYATELAGDWRAAAAQWRELGCPYEAALALAEGDTPEPLLEALDQLQALGAAPAAAVVVHRLRRHGARGVPRGPRRATRANPAGLTMRQVEVLGLLGEGLRNSEIAARLVLSERTVGHHVGAILRKLGVDSRARAGVEAARLGLSAPKDR